MIHKGSNLVIQEARQQIMSSFNNALQEIPITVLELLVKDLLNEIAKTSQEAIIQEQQQYQEALQKEYEEQNKDQS